jgi:choline dehydrogenase-like flavoprotein
MHDYVIVGAGAAGCVLAARLSADPAVSVLLLEAGPHTDDERVRDPNRWAELAGSRYDWAYWTEPQHRLSGQPMQWPRGRMIGGSTAMNAMVYLRGMPGPYGYWAQMAGDDWAYPALRPFFELVEAGPDHDGVGLRMTRRDDSHPWCEAFVAAAKELGFGFNADLDRNGSAGVGYYTVTRTEDGRQGAADGYLAPAASRPNLTIAPQSCARSLDVAGDHATGVRYISADGVERTARASRELIIAAGVIGSAHLLLLSGIGPAQTLRRHGIPVRIDLPGVGRNLHDHLAVSVRFPSANPDPVRTGSGLADAGLFAGSAGHDESDMHLWLAPTPGADDESFTVAVGITRPLSRGLLTLASRDAGDAPLLQPSYLASDKDLGILVAGLRLITEIAGTHAIQALRKDPQARALSSDTRSLERFVRANASTQFHPVGTCRMGCDELAVVDPELRVRGLENVRVVDASVIPSITTGGTQGPTYAIAEKAAVLIGKT